MARLCVALLAAPCALNTTFEVRSTVPFSEVYNAPEGAGERDWAALLAAAGLDERVTGKQAQEAVPA